MAMDKVNITVKASISDALMLWNTPLPIPIWVEFSTLNLEISFNRRMAWLVMIQMQNAQTLQLFTKIIKTESIYKSY